MIVAIF